MLAIALSSRHIVAERLVESLPEIHPRSNILGLIDDESSTLEVICSDMLVINNLTNGILLGVASLFSCQQRWFLDEMIRL